MEDLSGLLAGRVDALVPSSQSAGGEPHRNDAMTARPVAPSLENSITPGEVTTHPAPQVDAADYDVTATHTGTEAGGGQIPDENHGRPSLFADPPRAGWRDDDNGDVLPETSRKPRIQLGRWNNV